jgi:hypothetical protein
MPSRLGIYGVLDRKPSNGIRIRVFALWGAIGYSAGGAIGGAVWFNFDAPQFGFAILGAVGGALLGMVSGMWSRRWIPVVASAVGLDVGFMLVFFLALVVAIPIYGQGFFMGAVGGAIGGAALGIALRGWKNVGLLALASAVGFGIAVQVTRWALFVEWLAQRPHILMGASVVAIWGAIGGAFVGAALGYIHKRRLQISTTSITI